MIEPEPGGRRACGDRVGLVVRAGDLVGPDLVADRDAVDPQPGPLAVVRLDQGRDGEAAVLARPGPATRSRSRP